MECHPDHLPPAALLRFAGATLWNVIQTTFLGVPRTLVNFYPPSHYRKAASSRQLSDYEKIMLEALKEQADRFDGDLPHLKELKKGYDQLIGYIEKDDRCIIRVINICLNPTKEQKTYVTKTILDICAAEGISVQVTNQNFISRRMAEPRNWSMSIVDDVARLAKRHGYASEFKR